MNGREMPEDVGQATSARPLALIIHNDEIIDGLKRELLPEALRNLTYPGSKPAQWPTGALP